MAQELNKYQKEAVYHLDGPCMVTSCPGSGKTFVIVERITCLISRKVKPSNILGLTFTNKAATEMKERICKRLGVDKLEFFMGTFHSFCAKMLRHVESLKPAKDRVNFTIIDGKDQVDLVLQIAGKMEIDIKKGDAFKIVNSLNFYRDQMEDKSWLRSSLRLDPYVKIANRYLDHCKECGLLDFSALIYDTIKVIEENTAIRTKIQNTFKYIMVDETQDTNKSQFYLINLLGAKWNNIMIVGDVDQSIYRFRGARYQNIQDFIENHDNCKIISLSKNYRSTPQIVKVASKLIKYNSSHMGTSFETNNPDGDPVRCYSFGDQYVEAEWVAKTARRFIDEGGWAPSDIAVLYRVNKMSEPVERALVSSSIPYEVVGNRNFYDRKEIRDCLSMLKLLSNPKDGIAFGRVCSFVDGMGSVTVGRIENIAQDRGITIPEACKIMGEKAKSIKITRGCDKISKLYNRKWDCSKPSVCLSELVDSFNYNGHLAKKFDDTCNERKDNIQQIITSAGECNGDENGVSKYLQQVSLVTNAEKKDEEDKMSLMSIHSSKGLEFPIVFIIGAEQDILPHKTAVSEDPDQGLQEERRLQFVAATRAKKSLLLSWCEKRSIFGKKGNRNYNKCQPSQFLFEMGLLKRRIK